MTLFSTLLPIVRHCSSTAQQYRALPQFIEIECRVLLEPAEFFATVQMLAGDAEFEFVGATKQRDAILQTNTGGNAGKLRTSYAFDSNEPLFTIEKRDMLAAGRVTLPVGAFEMRVSAERECYLQTHIDTTTPPLFWRGKDRRTFVCRQAAPAWHIDFTRAVNYRDSPDEWNARVAYELEFELQQSALLSEEPEKIVHQLEHIVDIILLPSAAAAAVATTLVPSSCQPSKRMSTRQ
jgi:hypothetical protein